MSDFTMIDYSGDAVKADEAIFSFLNLASEITGRHIVAGVALIIALVFLLRHRRIMAEVRGQMLTIAGVLSGAIHAVLIIGLYKLATEF